MRKKKTFEEFVKEAGRIHNDKYSYEKFIYIGYSIKGIIICPKHGEFLQNPSNHLYGYGCKKCGSEKRNKIRFGDAANKFITRSIKIHNGFYDYSKMSYINNFTKVIIICPKHGEFLQRPSLHLSGRGCYECGLIALGKQKRSSLEKFIERANNVHSNKFDYSKSIYINARTKIAIICPKHGKFEQTPDSHLRGCGCQKCYGNFIKGKEQFIIEANLKHNNKYIYNHVEYKSTDTKVTILCPEHGKFEQTPYHHLNGDGGCPICRSEKLNLLFKRSFEEFTNIANKIHNNKYDYSKFIYINDRTKGIIICQKHGEFLQTPSKHLIGHGCIKCSGNISKKSQKWLDSFNNSNILREYLIKIESCSFHADGYDPISNTIYEFYGDFWHGNPNKFYSESINRVNKKSFGKLYELTISRENLLKTYGYNLISIWEEEFDRKFF